MKISRSHCLPALFGALLVLSMAPVRPAATGSATWQLNPVDGNWYNANNWMPATVPGDSRNIATFDVSNITAISAAAGWTLSTIAFNPGASAFTITLKAKDDVTRTFYTVLGAGVTNNSGINQTLNNFNLQLVLLFVGSATAGEMTTYSWFGGGISFRVNSSADHAVINNNVGVVSFFDSATASYSTIFNNVGGEVDFIGDKATAGNAMVTNAGNNGTSLGFAGHTILRSGRAHAADATFTTTGTNITNGKAGYMQFNDNSTADGSILIASGGRTAGGMISFNGTSTGDLAQVQLSGNGTLDVSGHAAPGVGIGSLAGTSGSVLVGANNLAVGANKLTTAFAGVISDGGLGGSLTKTSRGNLTLRSANTYTGATTVSAGGLIVTNSTGSATCTGPVQVDAGQLGGRGIIAGATTIGTGSGTGATLMPEIGSQQQVTLTFQSTLIFDADASYSYFVNSGLGLADKVVAHGVALGTGAQFTLRDRSVVFLPVGTVFTALSNTSANPIAGTFANLPDGAILTVGANIFQANYEGGDGNDLTLTVVP